MHKVILIARDECFSPHSEANDLAILKAVEQRLISHGYKPTMLSESSLSNYSLPLGRVGMGAHMLSESSLSNYSLPSGRVGERGSEAPLYLSMGRHESTLDFLREKERQGIMVINSADGVGMCVCRSRLDELMRCERIPVPPIEGEYGYWLKRGDISAQSHDDIVFAADEQERDSAMRRFHDRGIKQVVVSSHVPGDVVKFYGVEGVGFFRVYYPTDDGVTKFGDEQRNGTAHHYPFELDHLRHEAERLSRLVGVPVYGGDAVVTEQGQFCIIDFNDWPSFSRCREAAADAITELLIRI